MLVWTLHFETSHTVRRTSRLAPRSLSMHLTVWLRCLDELVGVRTDVQDGAGGGGATVLLSRQMAQELQQSVRR